MACVGSGSGGAQPPHEHPRRLPDQCEADGYYVPSEGEQEQPTATKNKQGGRGGAKGLNVQKEINSIGGKIQMRYEPRNNNKLRVSLGPSSTKYKSEIGRVTRARCLSHLGIPDWESVPEMCKQQIFGEIETHFDPVYFENVTQEAGIRFRKWRGMLKKKVEESEVTPCPRPNNNIEQTVWDSFLRRLQDPVFRAQCERNSTNRNKKKYTGTQGMMTNIDWRYHGIDPNNNPYGRCPIATWADRHKDKTGNWVNENARIDYERLLEIKQQLISGDDPIENFDQETMIFERALGTRRDYVIGLGPKQKKKTILSERANDHEASTLQLKLKVTNLEKKLEKKEKSEAKSKKKNRNLFVMMCGMFKKQNPEMEMPPIDISDDNEEEDNDDDVDL